MSARQFFAIEFFSVVLCGLIDHTLDTSKQYNQSEEKIHQKSKN